MVRHIIKQQPDVKWKDKWKELLLTITIFCKTTLNHIKSRISSIEKV